MTDIRDELASGIAELAELDRAALAARWTSVFGVPAPRGCRAPLLRSALAWQLQMQASPEWRSAVAPARLARSLRPATPAVSLAPGTRLLREWQGRTHHVTVTAQGYDYAGKT